MDIQYDLSSEEDINSSTAGILQKLYISHTLSAWNSRLFEFGAVLFLARIFPGTLFYASTYALCRALAATFLSSYVGLYLDREHRLVFVRWSIILQRSSVVLSGILLTLLLEGNVREHWFWLLFSLLVLFACVEKLSNVANTVAVERDWIVIVAATISCERQVLNATIRRIDLICKLAAPLLVSFVDAYDTTSAVYLTTFTSLLSVCVEYYTIASVYRAVPALSRRQSSCIDMATFSTNDTVAPDNSRVDVSRSPCLVQLMQALDPWVLYFTSPVVLPSLALSLLYLTVLSTGVQYQTFMLALGFNSTSVSLIRMGAVLSELGSTLLTPLLASRIGTIRLGLWSVNWQLGCLIAAMAAFVLPAYDNQTKVGYVLSVGIIASRMGLWGFDLCVQDLIQDETKDSTRGRFSASEAALQNFFELLSFTSTMVFAKPEEFKIPSAISLVAVATSAVLFATFVRKRRGHLLHPSRCMQRKQKYHGIDDEIVDEME